MKAKIFWGVIIAIAVFSLAIAYDHRDDVSFEGIHEVNKRHTYAMYLVSCGVSVKEANDETYQNEHGYYAHIYPPYKHNTAHPVSYEVSIYMDTMWVLDGDRLVGSCRWNDDTSLATIIINDNQ